jgi:hypothetical protein
VVFGRSFVEGTWLERERGLYFSVVTRPHYGTDTARSTHGTNLLVECVVKSEDEPWSPAADAVCGRCRDVEIRQ